MIPYKVMLKIRCGCNALGYYWHEWRGQASDAREAAERAERAFAGNSEPLAKKIMQFDITAYP